MLIVLPKSKCPDLTGKAAFSAPVISGTLAGLLRAARLKQAINGG
jgi:hypothetical protein